MRPAKLLLVPLWFMVLLTAVWVSAQAQSDKPSATPQGVSSSKLDWRSWSDDVFAEAKRDHKFVLLDLEAVWCHWCHVMDVETYQDPAVKKLLEAKYLLVKVDQDSRPDLSNRYEDYGWPATVVFNGDGGEIVKRQGYIAPKEMSAMLQAIIDDPTPGPSVTNAPASKVTAAKSSQFSPDILEALNKSYDNQYDKDAAGWGFGHKYLDGDSIEYAMYLAARGDKQAEQRARDTLKQELKLIDPVWGGAYQYSVGGNWDEPHFEKLISIQAQVIRIYSEAYERWKDPAYLKAAQSVHAYVQNFLMSPDGTFYVSQDADVVEGEHSAEYFKLDDAARRKQGIPRVDKHVYARENGWMIAALCELYKASGDQTALAEAKRAADWIGENRSLPHGGFRHAEKDVAGPYLGDTLAMGQGFFALYNATHDAGWLQQTEDSLGFINFYMSSDDMPGFLTSKTPTDNSYKPHPERDENVQVVRLATAVFEVSGNATDEQIADSAMRYLAAKENALRPMSGGVLQAHAEFSSRKAPAVTASATK
jgi:uncharacterized protein YyaL (SSP411 family)